MEPTNQLLQWQRVEQQREQAVHEELQLQQHRPLLVVVALEAVDPLEARWIA